jgi:hypothetical protein
MRSNDETKLPKWAQEEMARLRSRATYWQDEAAKNLAAREDVASTDTVLRANIYRADQAMGLPPGSSIRFTPSMADRPDEFIEARIKDGVLEIYAGRRVTIRPVASNRVDIELEPR